MTENVFIGIDLGTTVLKVCAFSTRTGAVLGQESIRLTVHSFPEGGYEIELKSIDRAFKKALKSVLSQLNSQWNPINGIGLASQAGSSLIAERQTGKALTPMILWNDGRSYPHTKRLSKQVSAKYWRRYLLSDSAPAGLGRLIWMKEKYPDVFQDDNIHVGAGEYLFFRLTGIWRQDAGNAVQIGSYNAVTQKLFPTLFKKIDIPLSFVAPLREPNETAVLSKEGATFTGLSKGIPVAGPYFDQEACYLSATGASERPLQISLGTAWVGNFILPHEIQGESPTHIVVRSPMGDGNMIVQPLMTGNPTWEWGLRNFVHRNINKALSKASEIFTDSIVPYSSVQVLPWLSQSNPFFPELYGGGSFLGLSDQTTPEDLLRALMNSMTFELARVFQKVKDSGVLDCVVVGGGASRSEHFCSMIAALFSPLPLYRQVDESLSAARGSVYFFDRKSGQSRVQKVRLPNQQILSDTQKAYDRYVQVFEKIYGGIPAGKAYRVVRRTE